jgi:hypothetical protein
MNWDDWTYRTNQMEVRGNWLSHPSAEHPDNGTWDGVLDGWRLARFVAGQPGVDVGMGFALREVQLTAVRALEGLPVGLSSVSTQRVSVDYEVEAETGLVRSGTLEIPAGQIVAWIPVLPEDAAGQVSLRVTLLRPVHAVVTGVRRVYVLRDPVEPRHLVAKGSSWRYHDRGTDPGSGWAAPGFDDSGWKAGLAELGFGDGDEATVVEGGPSAARHAAVYFRHGFVFDRPERFRQLVLNVRQDDGAIVYLNGVEVYRMNVPAGPVDYRTYTGTTISSETQFFTAVVAVNELMAGTNLLAAEVHQSDATSSDLSFDLFLEGIPEYRLYPVQFPEELVLMWHDAAANLEEGDTVRGPWRLRYETSPAVVTPGGPMYYRLRRP